MIQQSHMEMMRVREIAEHLLLLVSAKAFKFKKGSSKDFTSNNNANQNNHVRKTVNRQ